MYAEFYRHLKKNSQFLLFSATYEDRVMKFAESIVPNPIIIRLKRSEESLNNIKQFYIRCRNQQEKFEALSNIYGTISIGQAMVFCHVSHNLALDRCIVKLLIYRMYVVVFDRLKNRHNGYP